MTDDDMALVERLRNPMPPHHGKCLKAADRIEALSAENKRLREALRPFAEAWDEREYLAEAHWSDFKKASAALGETK